MEKKSYERREKKKKTESSVTPFGSMAQALFKTALTFGFTSSLIEYARFSHVNSIFFSSLHHVIMVKF